MGRICLLLSLPAMLLAGYYKSKSEINKIHERLRMGQEKNIFNAAKILGDAMLKALKEDKR